MLELTPEFIESELKRFSETPPQTGEALHAISVIAAALLLLLKKDDSKDGSVLIEYFP